MLPAWWPPPGYEEITEDQVRDETVSVAIGLRPHWASASRIRRIASRRAASQLGGCDPDRGWLPPRQFLRLLRAFRDMRRTMGTVVMTGGQLNVAEHHLLLARLEQQSDHHGP